MGATADYDDHTDVLYVSLVKPIPAERIRYKAVENAHVVFRYQDDKLVGISMEAARHQAEKARCKS